VVSDRGKVLENVETSEAFKVTREAEILSYWQNLKC